MNLDQLKQKTLLLLEKKLTEKKLSGAHSKSHLTITANLTQLIGKIYKFSDRELFLVYFAAIFHDIVRSPSQDKQLGDEVLSAKEAVKYFEDFNPALEEKEAVSYAIENHGDYPSFLTDEKLRNINPDSLRQKLRFALFVSDKIEQNGVRVIARRSAFIAERFAPTGDLLKFGFLKNKDKLLALGLESVIRLTFINPQHIYPAKLQPFISPLYKIQINFTLAILRAANLSVKEIAHILLNTKRADGKNLLSVRKINIRNENKLIELIEKSGQITDQKIKKVSNQRILAAVEAAEYFSKNYQKDLDQMMNNWKPKTSLGKVYKVQMVEYLNGIWLNSVYKNI